MKGVVGRDQEIQRYAGQTFAIRRRKINNGKDRVKRVSARLMRVQVGFRNGMYPMTTTKTKQKSDKEQKANDEVRKSDEEAPRKITTLYYTQSIHERRTKKKKRGRNSLSSMGSSGTMPANLLNTCTQCSLSPLHLALILLVIVVISRCVSILAFRVRISL